MYRRPSIELKYLISSDGSKFTLMFRNSPSFKSLSLCPRYVIAQRRMCRRVLHFWEISSNRRIRWNSCDGARFRNQVNNDDSQWTFVKREKKYHRIFKAKTVLSTNTERMTHRVWRKSQKSFGTREYRTRSGARDTRRLTGDDRSACLWADMRGREGGARGNDDRSNRTGGRLRPRVNNNTETYAHTYIYIFLLQHTHTSYRVYLPWTRQTYRTSPPPPVARKTVLRVIANRGGVYSKLVVCTANVVIFP